MPNPVHCAVIIGAAAGNPSIAVIGRWSAVRSRKEAAGSIQQASRILLTVTSPRRRQPNAARVKTTARRYLPPRGQRLVSGIEGRAAVFESLSKSGATSGPYDVLKT